MIRKAIYSTEQILPLIGTAEKVPLDGEQIRVNSLRLRNFKEHGITCVSCGLKGSFFAVEKSHQRDISYHLNLYAIKDGYEVLMTRDHILALADNGPNNLENLQTMCSPCNVEKGSEKNKDFGNKIKITRNSILTKSIDPIDTQMDPSTVDSYHNQFINLGSNVVIAAKIEKEKCLRFYIYNKASGERLQISLK